MAGNDKPPKPLRKKFERKLAKLIADGGGEDSIASRARASAPPADSETADKVAHIAKLMVAGDWNSQVSKYTLAGVWGMHPDTVKRFATEAHRRISLDDEEKAQERAAHALFCERIQREALAMTSQVTGLPDFGAALKATELAAKFKGIELAPSKVELTGKNGGAIALSIDDIDTALAAATKNEEPTDGAGAGDEPSDD